MPLVLSAPFIDALLSVGVSVVGFDNFKTGEENFVEGKRKYCI